MKKQFKNKARYLGLKFTAIVFALLLISGQSWGQGTLSNPIFQENFGTLADATALTTSNTAFSYIRVSTSSTANSLVNQIVAKNPGSFTGSSGLVSAKGTSVSTVDKTGLSSFSSGTFTFKFKTPASLTSAVMLSAVGTGASFGSANGFSGAQLSAAFQVTGTNLQIRATGAWTTVQTVAVSTSYEICIVFNNTAGSLSYGDSKTLPSNKCHVWINGSYVNEYAAATASLAASAFRIYTTTAQFEVDDIAVYNSLPASPILAPTTQAHDITFSSVTSSGMKIDWTNGNGTSRAVFVKEASGTITDPVDGTTYTASTDWGSKGTQLGTSGYYCVYNGTGTTVTLTNLAAGTAYYVQVFEYNGSGATSKYYTTTATGNPNNQTTASASTPTLSVGALSGSFGSQCTNGTYGPYMFNITGTALSNANVNVGALNGYSYSTTSGGSYTSSLDLTQPGGAYSQDIYVKFTPTVVQSYDGNIVVSGGGASSVNRSVTGSGINTAPTVTTPTSANLAATTATLGGNITVVGCADVTERGIYWSTTNGFADGAGTKASETPGPYSTGVFTLPVTGLPQGSTVYFKAFATSTVGTVYTSQASFATIKDEPSNHVTAFAANQGSPSYSSITVTWADATGAIIPDGYLIKASIGSITAPVDGTAEADAALVKNIAAGVQTLTFTGLSENTTYNFEIYPYTNSGTSINYKTDGTVPTASAATTIAPIIYTVNFDDIAKWTAGSVALTSYALNHTYIDGDFSATGGPALRNATTAQDGYAGALGSYSWRLTNAAAEWIITIANGGVSDFSIDIRRWDNSPSPDYSLDYSIDNGSNWINVATINNTSLDNSSAWKSFNGSINSSVQNILIRLKATGTTERIMIDNFIWSPKASTYYTSTGSWSDAGNWNNGIPTSSDDVSIYGEITITSAATCNNLTIENGGKLTINDGFTLTPSGTLTIEDGGTIIDKTATQSTLTATVKRNLTNANWTNGLDGWHLVASPNTAQPITGNWITGNYDFYGYSEATNTWLNHLDSQNPFSTFSNGKGYLVAYETAINKEFQGTLNNIDVPVALSYNTGQGNGWNLLGNPFPSNLIWYNGSWSTTNIEGIAKVWIESTQAYSDVNALGVIPANQGFWVKANAAVPGFVIPQAARTHTAQLFNKTSQNAKLTLSVSTTANTTQGETNIVINDQATNGYDMQYEGTNLYGGTISPNIYSVLSDGHQLSTNAIPTPANGTIVNLGFKAALNGNYTITADGLSNFTMCSTITLEDLKTNTTQNLLQNPVYNFTATTTDNANRFVLHFATSVGVNEIGKTNGGIYAYDNNIYVNTNEQIKQISVYNAMGQLIKTVNNVNGLQKINMNGNASGYYIVKVICDKNVYSEKVLIK